MPASKKPTRKSGTKKAVTKPALPAKPGFDPKQSKLPHGLQNGRNGKGGKPKLFPGRTGGR